MIPGNVEKLHRDYAIGNYYVVQKYSLKNEVTIPTDFDKELINQICSFDLEGLVQNMNSYFVPIEDDDIFFFTKEMTDEYIERACEMLEDSRDVFPSLDADGFRRSLERNLRRGTVLCAVEDDFWGFLIYSPPLSQISFLLVDRRFRGRGIGEALLRRAIEILGGSEIYVETYCEGIPAAAPARALYHKLGFTDGEILEGYEIPQQRLMLKK